MSDEERKNDTKPTDSTTTTTTTSAPPTGLFKKKKRRKKKLRKKPVPTDDDEASEDEDLSARLEEVRERQRFRDRRLLHEDDDGTLKPGVESEQTKQRREARKKEQGKGEQDKEAGKFLGAFSAEVRENAIKNDMEKYIDEELRKKRKRKSTADSDEDEDEQKKKAKGHENLDSVLFQVPEHYRERQMYSTQEADAGDRWLSGIMEIELPIESKLKNIEKTEAAKLELVEQKAKDTAILQIPGNFNSNFAGHHMDHTQALQKRRRDVERGKTDPVGKPSAHVQNPRENQDKDGEKRPFATDDRVLDRFIKRYKWR